MSRQVSPSLRLALDVLRTHRREMALGIVLLLIARGTAVLLPAATKFVYDDVIEGGRTELLLPIAASLIAATVIIAVASYLLTRILGVSAQRSIADLRIDVQRHVMK